MAKFRIVRTDFWDTPIVSDEMSPEDKLFYIYLLTNSQTTQIGIYKITKRKIAFDLGYNIESVLSLMDRFIEHYKLIRYNPETKELAIKNWGKENIYKAGKPVMDCIQSELKEVVDTSLIQFVAESMVKQEIRILYKSFCEKESMSFPEEERNHDENDTYIEKEKEELDDRFLHSNTILRPKENENKKEKQQPKTFNLHIEDNPILGNSLHNNPDAKEIIEFWDSNGFGFSNVNAKQQLLNWLDDSSFLQPKEIILKAMNIACANNKRKLNYIVGILKNWENESLLTVEEIDTYQDNQKPLPKQRKSAESFQTGRDIPRGFVLDLTAGEE